MSKPNTPHNSVALMSVAMGTADGPVLVKTCPTTQGVTVAPMLAEAMMALVMRPVMGKRVSA